MKFANWRAAILANPQEDAGNKIFPAFSEGSAEATTGNDRIRAVADDPLTMLLAIGPITKTVRLYHHLRNFGGARTRPNAKFVALEGLGSTAIPMFFPEEGFTSNMDSRVPTPTELMKAATPQGRRPQASTGKSSHHRGWRALKTGWMIQV